MQVMNLKHNAKKLREPESSTNVQIGIKKKLDSQVINFAECSLVKRVVLLRQALSKFKSTELMNR